MRVLKKLSVNVICKLSVNVISKKYIGKALIEPKTKMLEMWDKTKKSPLGECFLKMRNPVNSKKYLVKFTVVEDCDLTPLLGVTASQRMGLISINEDNFNRVAAVAREPEATSDAKPEAKPEAKPDAREPEATSDTKQTDVILENHKTVFDDEIGCIEGKVTLRKDETVTPTVSPSRKVPISLRQKIKLELDTLVEKDVIVPVTQPTDWVSAMVVAMKKNGTLRVCIDPRSLNKALKRELFPLRTLDDVLPELSKARVISTIDLKSAFWQVQLDEASSMLTTFATPYGRHRWLRLPFGLKVSSEVFARKLEECIGDLEGVFSIADDLMVCGTGATDEEATRDHDKKLEALLERCERARIKLNSEKMRLKQKSVSFLGHLVTSNGLKPDPAKVEAVIDMKKPTDVHGVQRLNGVVNYLARYLPKLSEVMEPIRQLTKKDVPWNWSGAQDKALKTVKQLITAAPVLRYYDPDRELTVQCDASQTGLGATFMQHGQPIAFASRALTPTEVRYAQIEKEMLAIVWSLEKFHQYVYGQEVIVLSDHKPLQSIMRKPLASAPRRLQSMMMRLQRYDVSVTYVPGKELMIAGTLSRAHRDTTEGEQEGFENINAMKYVAMTESRMETIRTATEADQTMKVLKEMIMQGWPNDKATVPFLAQPYYSYRDELAVHEGIVFKGSRVVIPKSERPVLKEKIHLISEWMDASDGQESAFFGLIWDKR